MIKNNKVTNYYFFIISAIFFIALILVFAEPSWAFQQKITEKEAQKKVNDAYITKEDGSMKITGMASGGNVIGGIVAIIIGIIIGVIAVTYMTATGLFAGADSCFASPASLFAIALCIGLLVTAIVLIIVGIMLMAKAKEVKKGEHDDANQGLLQAQLEQQARTNQAQSKSGSQSSRSA